MKHHPHSWISRPWLNLLGVAMLTAGCNSTGPEEQEILVVNETEGVVFFMAIDLETSHLVDPIPSFEYTPGEVPVLQPGASTKLQLDDIFGEFRVGEDLVLFIYRITDDLAELSTLLTLTAEELRSSNFRIEITES